MPWPYAIVACSIGFHVLAGRRRPADFAGKSGLRRRAEARRRENMSHIVSGGSASAIFAAPTFDDFWITCSTRQRARRRARRGSCRMPIVHRAAAPVWITVSGRILPASSAAAIVNGFSVEPGSNTSVSARLRMRSRATLSRRFGLYVGQLASARISPVCDVEDDERRPPSPCAARRRPSARGTRGTAAASRSPARDRVPPAARGSAATSSTASLRRLMITRRLPGAAGEPCLLRELHAFLARVAVAGEADRRARSPRRPGSSAGIRSGRAGP